MEIVIILAAVIVAAWIGMGYVGFRAAILRGHELNIRDRDSYRGTSWDKYHDEIMEGIRWIESRERERVEIVSDDGLKLVGRLTLHPGAKGIVLMFHGYRTHPEIDFSASSHVYYEAGNHILHIDQRAAGESEGKYIGFGVLESRDCRRWCEYALQRFGPEIRIYLGGLSMGASTVLMAVGRGLPENVCGIVADSAFSSPAEIIQKKIHQTYKIRGGALTLAIGLWAKLLARYSLWEMSIPEIMETNTIPVFFIHGKADSLVPVEMTERAAAACWAPKQVLFVDGAEHGTGYLMENEIYRNMLAEFVDPEAGRSPGNPDEAI